VIDPDVALLFSGLFGIAVFLAGIVMGNSVLFRMQRALNEQGEPEEKVSPWKVIGKGGGKYETFERYKTRFGDSSLVHQDRFAARLICCGAIVGFPSLLILKVRN
jgi:hypothetical protein